MGKRAEAGPGAAPLRRGRRPGTSGTREAVLAAAREAFASRGYAGASVRGIAAAAGVDAALVHHYFGTKDQLFVSALELPIDPREALGPAIAGGAKGAAERMLRVFLSVWDDPEYQLPLLAVARTVTDPASQRLVAEGFLPVVMQPIGVALGIDRPERRMPLVASQIMGLIVVRYLLRVEPVASMEPDDIVAIYAPTIQRYLTGDLPLGDGQAGREGQ